jgi:glucan phosphorylase
MEFFEKFLKVRSENKKRFINWLKKKIKFEDIDDRQYTNTLFDFIPKRVDENKRQLMCLVYVVYRYL